VQRGTEERRRGHVGRGAHASAAVARGGDDSWGDDKEVGGHEVESFGEGEEAGVEGAFCLGLLKLLAVVEVCVGEYATQAAGE
jgi:hypothetical protein